MIQNNTWEQIDQKIQRKAIAHLQNKLPPRFLEDIKKRMEEDKDWASKVEIVSGIPITFHFYEGMGVRNILREKILDKELPSGNWDDYYLEALEIAAQEST